MKRTQQLVLGSFMIATLAFPSAFAFAEKKDGRAHGELKARASVRAEYRNNDSRWDSFWSKFFEGRARPAFAAENRAPVIHGITAPTLLSAGQEGTWEVRASDPENGSLSYAVDWGDDNMFARAFNSEPEFVQDASFSHVYNNGGTYTVRFTVKDEEGRTAKSSVTVHVEGDEVDVPVISDLSVKPKSPYKAKIVWDTDIRADSAVWLSTSSPVDLSEDPDIYRLGKVKHHVINAKRLEPDTTYYAVVRSESRSGGIATSSEVTFTTPADEPENEDPVITSVAGPKTLEVGAEGEWTVNAMDPENGPLSYSVDWGDSAALRNGLMMGEPFVQISTFTHTYAQAGTYIITFTVHDDAGASAVATTTIEVTEVPPPSDETPPVIGDITVLAADESITVQWTTDEPSDSKVFFGTSTPVDVSDETGVFVGSDELITDHELVIDDLATSTLYYMRLQSVDESGNASLSDELSTTTEAGV